MNKHRKVRVVLPGSIRVVDDGNGLMRIMGNTRRQPEMLHEVDPSLVLNLMSLKWQAIEGDSSPPSGTGLI